MRSALAAVLRLLVLIVCAGLPPNLVRADDFSEFRIPAHRASGWDGTLSASGNHLFSSLPNEQDRQSMLRGMAGSAVYWRSESDSRFTSVDVQASGQGSRSRADRSIQMSLVPGFTQDTRLKQHDRFAGERWFAEVSTRRYPWSTPLGVSFDVWGQGAYGQSWSATDRDNRSTDPTGTLRSIDQDNMNTHNQSHRVSGSLALGMGKVRDATGIYEALVIEQRLRNRGVVRGRLAAATRRRIAELLYVRYDVLSTVSRPARRMWNELEQILRSDDAVDLSLLDAESIQRAGEALFDGTPTRDALPVSPMPRRRGAFVGGAVQAGHVRFWSWGDTERFSRSTFDDSLVTEFRTSSHDSSEFDHDRVWAGPVGEWHRPIGPRLQLDVVGRALVALKGRNGRLDAFSSGTLGMIVADRWFGAVYGSHRRSIGVENEIGDEINGWSVQYGASIRYFIEDHLSLELSANEMQERTDASPLLLFNPPATFRRAGDVSLGLRYRFMGRFDAPRLTQPIRI